MKPTLPALLLLMLCACSGGRETTIVCYNVRSCRGMDGRTDCGRVAAVIREAAPDVAAILEVDSMTRRSGRCDVLGELARLTGLHATYASAIDYDGGRYGIGLLSRRAPRSVRRVPLPGSEEARVLLVADFGKYVFAATHLSLTEADRMASLPIIVREAVGCDKPFFLAGDWNAEPGSPFIEALRRHFRILSDTAQYTFPASAPDRCIDYIALLRRGGERVRTVGSPCVIDEPLASDHRPLWVTVAL